MSELNYAMEQHMAYTVLSIGRPFSFKDFLCFEVDGKEYRMDHGTIRNKLLAFRKKGIIEPDYNSGIAFYTLKGHRFGKPMTPTHTGVQGIHNDPLYSMLQDLPLDKQCIHDIRLRFEVPNIYYNFSVNTPFPKDDISKDILLPYWNINNAMVKVRIHKTNTVSVIIACAREPFPLDYNGIIRFFTTLATTEGLLVGLTLNVNHDKFNQSIQHYGNWIITMWHFGRDGLTEYTGEKFSITVEKAQHILERIYTKDFGKYKKIRLERQDYPKKTVFDAIEEKLNYNFQT